MVRGVVGKFRNGVDVMSNCIDCNIEFEFKHGKLFCSRHCKEQNKKRRRNHATLQEKLKRHDDQQASRAMWKALSKTSKYQRTKSMEYIYKTKFNMTLEEVEKLRADHSGFCDICGTDTPGGIYKKFHIDHIKGTQIIRGLLCNNCNVGIGWLKHDVRILNEAIKYLEKFKT